MRSLERRFNRISEQNPAWSSYVCFAEAIAKQNFVKKTIYFWFPKLVDKSDYIKRERNNLLQELTNQKPP